MSKPEIPSVYDFKAYADVLKHILEHGHIDPEVAKNVVKDPNHAPVMWHQIMHAFEPESCDHTHPDTSPEQVQEAMDKVQEMIKNPLMDEFLNYLQNEEDSDFIQQTAEIQKFVDSIE